MKELVFITEDDFVQQKILQYHFEEGLGNYTVKCFDSPDEMLQHLDEKPFAIVLDHHFAGKFETGLDYLNILSKKHARIPVIYHTSTEDKAVRENALKAGAHEFILKDGASLVRLRTALDQIAEKKNKKGLFDWFKKA